MPAWDEAAVRQAPLYYRIGRRLQEYGRLIRLDRPIGIYLLLWPTLWALWVAGDGHPAPAILVIFVVGVMVMRAAGCIVNDVADRNVDPHVRRTHARPLAARRLNVSEALSLFVLLMAIALFLALKLDRFTIELACIGALLTLLYPFAKRFFAIPQLLLALAFSWGVPMAFAALLGVLPRVAWVMFLATVLWVLIYDTLYAMVDRDDDLRIGVNSSAILFSDLDRVIVGILQLTMLATLWIMGDGLNFGIAYRGALIVAALLFIYQQWLIRTREPGNCLRAFANNHYVGLTIFVGIALEYVYRKS
jgi:4-hydroxybenzoate polyprenyltransferase